MKTLGVIGGIGPESTISYYRSLIETYRRLRPDGTYPPLILNSIDLKRMLDFVGSNRLPEATEYLLVELGKLAKAGADFGLLAANTPHLVFDELQRRSTIPLLSIVEATREAATSSQLKILGLFGTRFTMEGKFYPEVFSRGDITIVLPNSEERDLIHTKYMNELIPGVFLAETRDRLLGIVETMKKRNGIQGVILGGTELPLILPDASAHGIPFLDTTKIHVEAAIKYLLS